MRVTLLTDGPSDRALLPIIRWWFSEQADTTIQSATVEHADLRVLNPRPRGLGERMSRSVQLYPCDLLLVHRDAERESYVQRSQEVQTAATALGDALPHHGAVPVVPVRMTEAWLLLDETAIRKAAGNPRGTVALDLPGAQAAERMADPKQKLFETLSAASGLKGRKLKKFSTEQARTRVATFMQSFQPLRSLIAFRQFETDLKSALGLS
jgi:hypothetical protein